MPVPAQNVSVTLPVSQAFEHVKRVLFSPFQLEKWFAIGFCAWLAHLGQQGFRGTYGGGGHHGNMNLQDWTHRARDYVMNNLYWIVPVAMAVIVLGLAIGVLILWLSSRGRFMFLHCVARDRAEVVVPWQRFAREAGSVFWFRMALWGCEMIAILALGAAIGLLIWNMVQRGAAPGSIVGVVVLGGALLVVLVMAAIIAKLTTDFVVPILYLRGGSCLQGWGVLGGLLGANLGAFVLYLLFQVLLALAIGASVLALVLVTCCIAGCFLAIPYIGTVLFLPVLVFQRAYSIFYLRQYGLEYDALAAPTPGGPAPMMT